MDADKEIQRQVDAGYIMDNGFPLKCWKCGSEDLNFKDFYDEHIMVEQDVTCNSCGTYTGHWAYGQW